MYWSFQNNITNRKENLSNNIEICYFYITLNHNNIPNSSHYETSSFLSVFNFLEKLRENQYFLHDRFIANLRFNLPEWDTM